LLGFDRRNKHQQQIEKILKTCCFDFCLSFFGFSEICIRNTKSVLTKTFSDQKFSSDLVFFRLSVFAGVFCACTLQKLLLLHEILCWTRLGLDVPCALWEFASRLESPFERTTKQKKKTSSSSSSFFFGRSFRAFYLILKKRNNFLQLDILKC